MNANEVRRIREKFQLNQEQFAELFGLSGKKAVSNIETGFRNPSRLTAVMLNVLDSLPKRKAEELMELMLRQGKKER